MQTRILVIARTDAHNVIGVVVVPKAVEHLSEERARVGDERLERANNGVNEFRRSPLDPVRMEVVRSILRACAQPERGLGHVTYEPELMEAAKTK